MSLKSEPSTNSNYPEQLADWELELLGHDVDPDEPIHVCNQNCPPADDSEPSVDWDNDLVAEDIRTDDDVHVCDESCVFVFCPNDPYDEECDNPRRYSGDWMPYISSQDEEDCLAEMFDGWGYRVTTRP